MGVDIRTVLESQALASLAMLKACIGECPRDQFHERHGDYPFSQVAFHALFYCDFYFSESEEEFKKQPFHRSHAELFEGYEELEYRPARNTYEFEFLMEYAGHCARKIGEELPRFTDERLAESAKVKTNGISRLELVVDSIRHTQHHAAQLGLRVQLLTGKETAWVERGLALRG